MDSHPIGSSSAKGIPVLDIHELAAGKLAALFSRTQARDVFDCYQLLSTTRLDPAKLRSAFVAYGAMNREDWRRISINDLTLEPREVQDALIPTLRAGTIASNKSPTEYRRELLDECRRLVGPLLPFTKSETKFFDLLLEEGKVSADLITSDADLRERIAHHPLLEWKAVNVRKHKNRQ